MKLDTLLVRSGADADPSTGAIAPPIHLSTTFEHGPESETLHGYSYIRESNPTQDRLETALAAVESGQAALVFASGMAAGVACLQALPSGSHVLFHRDVYFGFRAVREEFFPVWGLTASVVDMTDLDAVREALRPETRLLWLETPSNPLMQILDITALAELAREAGADLLVDGTFATPALQRPLELGASVVLHSATKYLGGHSDVQGGVLVFARREAVFERSESIRTLLGPVASPFNSWLVLRGLRTLSCRMERHSANAQALAEFLASHPAVASVHYPGLPTHPGHAIAIRQMRRFSGMLSFQVKGGREAAIRVASRLQVFLNATSLGGVESLIEHRESMEGPGSLTPPDLLRVSVGLEDPQDLIDDLQQALNLLLR